MTHSNFQWICEPGPSCSNPICVDPGLGLDLVSHFLNLKGKCSLTETNRKKHRRHESFRQVSVTSKWRTFGRPREYERMQLECHTFPSCFQVFQISQISQVIELIILTCS